MDITRALHHAVHHHPAGTGALAAQLGMPVSTLLHKVSPTYTGAHCSPEEVAGICEATGDLGALHALAGRLEHIALPAPEVGHMDDTTAQQLATSVREFGEFVTEAAGALADNKVSANELKRLEREASQAIAAINGLLRLANQMHESSKPQSLHGRRLTATS